MGSNGEDEVPNSTSLQKHQTSIDLDGDKEVDDSPIEEAFYHRSLNLVAATLLIQTTQLLGKPGPSLSFSGITRR
ncbi:hypothetical protein Q3G72_022138 [Acer saccharum]|nr:hypothetical protein Q3G72_022138 [Acer saccharum]